MQNISVYIEPPQQTVSYNHAQSPDNLDHTRLRIRMNSPYSTQRFMELIGNIFRTLRYQVSQMYQGVVGLCYETWLNWDNNTSFWTRFSQWGHQGTPQDRIDNSRSEHYQHLEHPFQEVSLNWDQIRQHFEAPRVIPQPKATVNYQTFSQVVKVFKSTKKDVAKLMDVDCGICLEELKPNRMWAKLPCGHVFHSTCAKRWVCKHSKQPSCPTCRAPVVTK
jgi:hypothetical protein